MPDRGLHFSPSTNPYEGIPFSQRNFLNLRTTSAGYVPVPLIPVSCEYNPYLLQDQCGNTTSAKFVSVPLTSVSHEYNPYLLQDQCGNTISARDVPVPLILVSHEYNPNLLQDRCDFYSDSRLNNSVTLGSNDSRCLLPLVDTCSGPKRIKLNEGSSSTHRDHMTCWPYELEQYKHQINSKVVEYSNQSTFVKLVKELVAGKYRSVTKDAEGLVARINQLMNSLYPKDPTLLCKTFSAENNHHIEASKGKLVVIEDLTDPEDQATSGFTSVKAAHLNSSVGPVVIIDSDDEEHGNDKSLVVYQDIFSGKCARYSPFKDFVSCESDRPKILKDKDNILGGSRISTDEAENVGEDDDIEMEDRDDQSEANSDGLGDIWQEMNFAIESNKDANVDGSYGEHEYESGEDCEHSLILKDDIGYVCRICGIIQKPIESIIDQFPKGSKNAQTYRYDDGRTGKKMEGDEADFEGTKLIGGHDIIVAEIAAHPRHSKQMKPHQVEGFNFLVSKLVADNPGGCIMAHAPGSGKTFMIISFLQSFMAKYPFARPLVVLPRGILATLKKEFERWQVEDIPLYDFYSVKADIYIRILMF